MKIKDFITKIFSQKPQIKENEYTKKYIPKGILHHQKYEDLSGKTLGCGCEICLLRHGVYVEKYRKELLNQKQKQIEESKHLYDKVKDWRSFDISKLGLYQNQPHLSTYLVIGHDKILSKTIEKTKVVENNLNNLRRKYSFLIHNCQV